MAVVRKIDNTDVFRIVVAQRTLRHYACSAEHETTEEREASAAILSSRCFVLAGPPGRGDDYDAGFSGSGLRLTSGGARQPRFGSLRFRWRRPTGFRIDR